MQSEPRNLGRKAIVFFANDLDAVLLHQCRCALADRCARPIGITAWSALGETDPQMAALLELDGPVRSVMEVVGVEDLEGAVLEGILGEQRCTSVTVAVDEWLHVERGAPNEGVCRIGLVRRAQDLDRPTFAKHWIHVHAPLVLRAGARFERYATNVVVGDSTFDGVVQQWFRTPDAVVQHDQLRNSGESEILEDIRTLVSGFTSFIGRPVDEAASGAG